MTLPATDDFTDSNDVQIETHGDWTVMDGDFDIQSNGLAPDHSSRCVAYWNADTFDANQYAQATIKALTSGIYIGVAVRVHAVSVTYYGLNGTDSVKTLSKRVNGVYSQLASSPNQYSVDDVIRLEANATSIRPMLNGETDEDLGIQSDSSISSGSAGVSGYDDGTGSRIDDWEGGNLSEGGEGGGGTATSGTLAALADRAQLALADSAAGTWDQATVESWILDGIRDYSQYFPRVVTSDVEEIGAGATHYLDLPTDFLEMISVEFPRGDDPPTFLERRSLYHETFWDVEGYYDIQKTGQTVETPTGFTASRLVWSRSPDADEGYTLKYLAPHPTDLDSDDTITVRMDHEAIIILFVIWRALKERQMAEAANPDTTSRYLNQLVYAATQAELEYRRALERAEGARAEGGWTGAWKADGYDRIY
jgi:hypothetical protein